MATVVIGTSREVLREEAELRELAGLPARPRPVPTVKAVTLSLRAIPPLAGHQLVPLPRLETSARVAASWRLRALTVLGVREPWRSVPRVPGEPPARCPYCELPSLRVQPSSGLIRCVAPGCQDLDKERPMARLTAVRVRGSGGWEWRWELWWGDGTEGLGSRRELITETTQAGRDSSSHG